MRAPANDPLLDRIEARFDRVESRLESMQRTIIRGAMALSCVMFAGSVAVGVLVATQL